LLETSEYLGKTKRKDQNVVKREGKTFLLDVDVFWTSFTQFLAGREGCFVENSNYFDKRHYFLFLEI